MADTRRQSFKEPHVRTWRCKLDVAETLTANLRLRDLDAALVADDAAMLHSLVFSAETFPVRNRAEDACTEQSVALRLECPVVDRFRLGDLAVRPRTDLVRRREADADRFVICGQLRFVIVIKSKHISPNSSRSVQVQSPEVPKSSRTSQTSNVEH